MVGPLRFAALALAVLALAGCSGSSVRLISFDGKATGDEWPVDGKLTGCVARQTGPILGVFSLTAGKCTFRSGAAADGPTDAVTFDPED